MLPLKPQSKRHEIRWKTYQDRRPERQELVKWFANGNRNIGIVCGPVSENLGVRDFDASHAYEAWASAYAEAARELPTVATFRGYQVYFRTERPLKSSVLDDGELRCGGLYVVSPPSLHPEGVLYTWTRPPDDSIPIVDPISTGLAPGVTQAIDSCVT